MGRILRTYVIREVALPSLLALLTITFILLMSRVFELIDFLLRPGVGALQVGRILLSFLPSMMVFAVPMSILIGTLIGVGRMALDREVLAMRASGVNMLSVFVPALVLAALISLLMMGLSGRVIPKLLLDGMRRISELQLAIANSLEPGQLHDGLGGDDSDVVLYFRERDPKTQAMKGVAIKMEEDIKGPNDDKAAEKAKTPQKPALAAAPAANARTSGTLTALAADAKTSGALLAKAAKGEPASGRKAMLTMIFAESGVIQSRTQTEGDRGDSQKTAIVLKLQNGSVHRLTPANKQYVVIRFEGMEKRLFKNTTIEKMHKTRTNGELEKIVAGKTPAEDKAEGRKNKKDRELIGAARKELVERHSISLASFVFALIGIPLAIWMKPSGKSWGILLAIGLMLVYYILMKMGLSMVAVNKPLGVPVAFLPNLIFLALGAGLWWHSARS